MNRTTLPTYTLSEDKKVVYVSPKGFLYQMKINPSLKNILKKAAKNDMKLQENELVALNRFIMGKDEKIDFNCITSTTQRTIRIEEELKLLLLSK